MAATRCPCVSESAITGDSGMTAVVRGVSSASSAVSAAGAEQVSGHGSEQGADNAGAGS